MTADSRRSRSGPNIPEAQRDTARLCIRLRPDMAAHLRGLAHAWGLGLGETVEELLRRCGSPYDDE